MKRTFLLLALLVLALPSTVLAADGATDQTPDKAAAPPPVDTSSWNSDRWLAEGWKRRAVRDHRGALEAFKAAEKAGADLQIVSMEQGYVHTQLGEIEAARTQFERAAKGPNEKLKEQALLEIANLGRSSRAPGTVAHSAMTRAYKLCELEEWDAAVEALEEARAAGWDAQTVDLQLGYVQLQRSDLLGARIAFTAAAAGEDAVKAGQAERALADLPPGVAELTASDRLLVGARKLRDQRRWDDAIAAYKQAEADGANPQQVQYELGLIALELRDLSPRRRAAEAEAYAVAAQAEAEAKLAAQAEREEAQREAEAAAAAEEEARKDPNWKAPEEPVLTDEERAALEERARYEEERRKFATKFLNQAYGMKRTKDYEGAIAAFRYAADAGADAQSVALEIGFIELERGNKGKARKAFLDALRGEGEAARDVAYRQLVYLPSDDRTEWTGDHWLMEAYRIKAGWAAPAREAAPGACPAPPAPARIESDDEIGDVKHALAMALLLGVDDRRVALELATVGWIEADRAEGKKDLSAIQRHYRNAIRGLEADAYELQARRGLATTDPRPRAEWTADHWIAEAHFLADLGDYVAAIRAVELGMDAEGANVTLLEEYKAALEDAAKWTKHARTHLSAARRGSDEDTAAAAKARLDRLPPAGRSEWTFGVWLGYARFLTSLGDYDEARDAYAIARNGCDPQSIDLELGYLELSAGNPRAARRHFRAAKSGEDVAQSEAASGQLKVMPRLFSADLYAEAFGYSRLVPQRFDNLIGFARLRGFVRPFPLVDLQPYLLLQISRDVSSRGLNDPSGVPLILNDNALLLGGGILFRFWEQRAGVYAQVAAAFKLIRDGSDPVQLDVRVGAYVGPALATCNPKPQRGGARVELLACAEFYGDVTYVSRFDHNVFFFARGRFGSTWFVTGPVAWQPLVEGRFVKDIRNDYWNNLADVGLVHRWRLLTPIGLDLNLGVHTGRYLGLAHVEPDGTIPNPVPNPAGFLDLRLLLATYVIF